MQNVNVKKSRKRIKTLADPSQIVGLQFWIATVWLVATERFPFLLEVGSASFELPVAVICSLPKIIQRMIVAQGRGPMAGHADDQVVDFVGFPRGFAHLTDLGKLSNWKR